MATKLFTYKQIAAAYDHPVTTTRNHIDKLKLLGKFKKKSLVESSFTEKELMQLEKLLDFKLKR